MGLISVVPVPGYHQLPAHWIAVVVVSASELAAHEAAFMSVRGGLRLQVEAHKGGRGSVCSNSLDLLGHGQATPIPGRGKEAWKLLGHREAAIIVVRHGRGRKKRVVQTCGVTFERD